MQCPVCNATFVTLLELEFHVNDCLDGPDTVQTSIDTHISALRIPKPPDPSSSSLLKGRLSIHESRNIGTTTKKTNLPKDKLVQTSILKWFKSGSEDSQAGTSNESFRSQTTANLVREETCSSVASLAAKSVKTKLKGRGWRKALTEGKKIYHPRLTSTTFLPGSQKYLPEYKKIPDSSFAVDCFSFGPVPGISHYFLTHFHSDHYMGLSKKFSHGLIVCSHVTAAIVRTVIKVEPSHIVSAGVGESLRISNFVVTLLEANQ